MGEWEAAQAAASHIFLAGETMEYDLRPLFFEQVNWADFIAVCENTLDLIPTRGMDSVGVATTQPQAILHCIGLNNDPQSFHGNEKLLRHLFFGFIGSCNSDMLLAMALTDLDIQSMESSEEHNLYCFVATGTLLQWKYALKHLASRDARKTVRQLANKALAFFERAGFKAVWSEYKREPHPKDETFYLK